MTTYTTRQGDVLDAVCLKFYGHNRATEQVLAANPGLADKGVVYPAGLIIELPLVTAVNTTKRQTLWD